jgi:RimJ/RimL family protein N-acetyltransferase
MWDSVSSEAHKEVFGKNDLEGIEGVDYVLAVLEGESILGYVTVIEENKRVAYWQLGGILPENRAKPAMYRAYKMLIEWTLERYLKITTRIENTNTAMLRMAMKAGFVIQGVRVWDGKILLELHHGGM